MEKFGYAVLERALAKVFKLSPDAQAGVLRGRIIHLRRGGFGPQEAGRGNRIKYDHETAVKWLLALLLADAGVSPRTIQSLLEENWEQHSGKIVARASRSKTDMYLAIYYPTMRAAAGGENFVMSLWDFTSDDVGKFLRWMSDERSVVMFNLSACLRILDREIAAAAKSGGEGANASR